MTTFNLNLPITFAIPQILATTTPEENAFILELGTKAFTQIQQQGEKSLNQKIYKSLEDAAKEDFLKKEASMIQEIEKF